MRILFLSSFYPPLHVGGYPQWCYEVAETLKERGHTTGVLTSRYQLERAAVTEEDVFRRLHLEADLIHYQPLHFFKNWTRHRRENHAIVEQTIGAFQPDIVFVWGMWALSKSIAAEAERLLPSRVVYYLCDYWPADPDMHTAYWELPARHWFTSIPRWLLSRLALALIAREPEPHLQFDHAVCVSAAVRDILVKAGMPMERAAVIHGGTRLNGFQSIPERDYRAPLKLLYAGQLVAHKGVHTAIEAMSQLINNRGVKTPALAIVGSGNPDYEKSLRSLVARERLEEYVTFRGPVAREEMPAVLAGADVLIFPSIYQEPFARMTQEAMLAGLVVIATTTGGTKEILRDGENGLAFEAEDANALADRIGRLIDDPVLCRRLAATARRNVLEQYTLEKMVDRIENYLQEVLCSVPPANFPERLTWQ